jgi:hypothetical protein
MKHLKRARARISTCTASLLATALVAAVPASAQTRQNTPLYENPSAPVEQQEDCLRMTLEERRSPNHYRLTQKARCFNSAERFDTAKANNCTAGIGHFARPSDLTAPAIPIKRPMRRETDRRL